MYMGCNNNYFYEKPKLVITQSMQYNINAGSKKKNTGFNPLCKNGFALIQNLFSWLLLTLFGFAANAQDFSNKGKDFWLGYGYHVRFVTTQGNGGPINNQKWFCILPQKILLIPQRI